MNKKPIVFPEKSGDYKFVLFKSPKDTYLRMAKPSKSYEGIVSTFCKEMNISSEIKNQTIKFNDSVEYQLSIGVAELNLEDKLLLLENAKRSDTFNRFSWDDITILQQIYSSWDIYSQN